MITLHGGWLPATERNEAALALWAETTKSRRARAKRGANETPEHPFAAGPAELRRACETLGLATHHKPGTAIVRLPSRGAAPEPSEPWLFDIQHDISPSLSVWSVTVVLVPVLDALGLLLALPGDDDDTPGVAIAADLRYWAALARFSLAQLARQRFRPDLLITGDQARACWRPLFDTSAEIEQRERFIAALPPVARAVTRAPGQDAASPRALVDDFLEESIDRFVREYARLPSLSRFDTSIAERWLLALSAKQHDVALPASFVEQYTAWMRASNRAAGENYRVCFRLEPPADPEQAGRSIACADADARGWALRYCLQARDDPSLLVPAATVWQARGESLTFFDRTFGEAQERLLLALGLAARLFPPIDDSLDVAQPDACWLTAAEAYQFISETALLLRSAGCGVLLPGLPAKLGIKAKVSAHQSSGADGGVAGLSFDRMLRFDWQLALGDDALTPAEFEQLAHLKVPLVQIRGQWVELQPDQIAQLRTLWQKQQDDGALSVSEALQWALAPEEIGGLPVTTVEADGWFHELLARSGDPRQLEHLDLPSGFEGELRPYQATGFSWLSFLRGYGLGACLADDMGLGKTVQTIALLLHERANGQEKPALLVCPTSVVSNWMRELERFAPDLRVLVYHGSQRDKEDLADLAPRHDIVITSFALVPRDERYLAEIDWGDLIVDEAQNIKNPATRQAKALGRLNAGYRIALTGTPIENRLSELWSLFNFLNPGYLGSQSEFRTRFARPIERVQDQEATTRLKSLVSPFILRRVKTDPTVISDLPAKNEMDVYCSLSREQTTLYEAVVRDSLAKIEDAEGINRRGLVLATLAMLKQVCNHPAQFLKDGSDLVNRSGKLDRITAMLEEVRGNRERALIFTQFAEMGKMLKAHLEATFGDDVFFLHGGTSRPNRDRMVERFQNDPHAPFAFILSLKAGGTGLNLTRASHVFHFDRWWNPAVENQATDRAFRIGQTRNVQVYKFICAGTVEEQINEMIARKLALVQSIVGTSENWITEMSNDELRDLFRLRSEALA
jgi:SNF2 family DNA or RNA helicase